MRINLTTITFVGEHFKLGNAQVVASKNERQIKLNISQPHRIVLPEGATPASWLCLFRCTRKVGHVVVDQVPKGVQYLSIFKPNNVDDDSLFNGVIDLEGGSYNVSLVASGDDSVEPVFLYSAAKPEGDIFFQVNAEGAELCKITI